jgi:hypothetical protein
MVKKRKTKGTQTDQESLEMARDAEAASAAPEDARTGLEKLSDDIITSVSGEGYTADQLSELQDQIYEMDDDEQEKLKANVSSGITDRLTQLSMQAVRVETGEEISPDKLEKFKTQHKVEADEIAEMTVNGFIEESDLESFMSYARAEYEKRMRRAEIESDFKEADSRLPQLIGGATGALASLGIYQFLSDEEKTLIDTCQDEGMMNEYLNQFINEHSDELGVDDVDLDVDDIALLQQHYAEQNSPQEVTDDLMDPSLQKEAIDKAIDQIPKVSAAKRFATMLGNCKYIRLYNKASNDIEVSKKVLRYCSTKTAGDLASDLEGQDLSEGKFAEMEALRHWVYKKKDFMESELHEAVMGIKSDDLTDVDKLELLSEYNVDNMQIGDCLLLVYGSDEERTNWLPHTLGRVPTIHRAYNNWWGIKKQHLRANASYATGLLSGRGPEFKATREAVNNYRFLRRQIGSGTMILPSASSNYLKPLQAEIDALEKKVQDFARRADPSTPHNFGTKVKNNLMLERDRLSKQARFLCEHKAGMVLSEASKNTLHGGRFVEMLEGSFSGKGSIAVSDALAKFDNPKVAKAFLRDTLGKVPSTLSVDDIGKLRQRYVHGIGDIRHLKGTWEKAFNGFNDSLFSDNFKALKKSVRKGTVMDRAMKNSDYISGWGKTKYLAPKLVIPIAILGTELYGLAKGEVKKEEVGWDLAEAGAGFLPVIGTAVDIKAYFTGKSLSGRDLGDWFSGERMSYLAGAGIGLFADVMTVFGGAGIGIRAGVASMRAATKAGRGARTISRYGSIPFRMGAKISDSLHGFTKAGRLAKYKGIKNIEAGFELADLRKLRGLGEITEGSQAAKRLAYLENLEFAGEISKRHSSAHWLLRKMRGAKKSVGKGWNRAIGGVDPSALKSIERADDAIVAARTNLVKAKNGVQALETAGVTKDAERMVDALSKVKEAEHAVGLAKQAKHMEWTTREMKRIGNIRKWRHVDTAANYIFKGGLVAGGIAALTAYNTEEVVDTAMSVGGVATKPVGYAWNAMWDDHSSYSPIQKAILARTYKNRTVKKIDQKLAEARENGTDEMEVWKDLIVNKRNTIALAEARNRGVDVRGILAMVEAQASTRDIATGDSGRKLSESLPG